MAYLLSLLLLLAACAGLPRFLLAQSQDSREEFARAYLLYTNGKPAQAKELFQSSIESGYRLADYSLYYMARLAHDESNWEQSRKHLTELRRGFPHSVWYRPAALLLAKADIAEKKFAPAAHALRQLRSDKSAPREIADEAQFIQAQLHEAQSDVGRAYSMYRELRNGSPGSRWAAAARKEQARLRGKFPDQFALTTIEAQAEEADRLARERQSKDAEVLYKKILDNISEPARGCVTSPSLRNCIFQREAETKRCRFSNRSRATFPTARKHRKRCTRSAKSIGIATRTAAPSTISKLFWKNFRRAILATGRCLPAADIHEYFGRKDEAISLYGKVQKQFSKSQVRDDAVWRLAWLYYRSGELPLAAIGVPLIVGQSRNGHFATAALYWQARIAETIGRN